MPASSLISPHLLRAAALTPRRSTPHRTAPRRDAGQRSRGAGWCAVVLVRMHISVPHILIQGVITRLSSAHSHHCLNHPPPPSSSSRQPRPLAAPSPLPTALLHLLHLQPPSSFCGSPSPTQPPPSTLHEPLLPPSWKNLLADRSFYIPFLLPPPSRLSNSSDTQVSSLFPFLSFIPPKHVSCLEPACVLASVLALRGHVGAAAGAYIRVCRRLSFATRIIDTRLIPIATSALFLSDDEEVMPKIRVLTLL